MTFAVDEKKVLRRLDIALFTFQQFKAVSFGVQHNTNTVQDFALLFYSTVNGSNSLCKWWAGRDSNSRPTNLNFDIFFIVVLSDASFLSQKLTY